jgi:hypothetical protein
MPRLQSESGISFTAPLAVLARYIPELTEVINFGTE